MTIFSWLLLGHLVGDWLLQNDWMARNKHATLFNRACVYHCLVYTTVMVVTLVLAGQTLPIRTPYVAYALLMFVSHYLIDAPHLAAAWGRFMGQSELQFVQIVADQTFHLIVIALVIQFLLQPG